MLETEAMMKEVKIDYELYFLQQRRIAPAARATQLKAKVRELDRHFTINTQLKFKRNALKSQFSALRTQWGRIMAQIEAGTYRRHQVVADRHDALRREREKRGQQQAGADAAAAGDGAPDSPPPEENAERPKRPARRRKVKLPDGVYSEGSSSLFEAFVAAREKTGEGAKGLDEQKLHLTLKQHARAVKARTGAKRVAFRVAVEDGKTRVKVIPIRK
jgi:hypothetical protein